MRLIDKQLLRTLSANAASRPRRRLNLNLHAGPEDPVQRFLNALEPDSYVRPHRHVTPPRWELFLVLNGAIDLLTFDEDGRVEERFEIRAGGPRHGIELPSGTWHTLIAREPQSVMFELKPGPYSPTADKDFAPWAPKEGEPLCEQMLHWFCRAAPGERFSGRT